MRKQMIISTLEEDTKREYSEIGTLAVKRGKVILRTSRYRHVWLADGTERELFDGDTKTDERETDHG